MTRFIRPDNDEFPISTAAASVMPSVLPSAIAEWGDSFDEWLKKNMRMMPVTLNLPIELQAWIGRLASYWALAEWIQAGTLAGLLGIGRKEARVMFGDRIGNCVSKIKQNMEMKDLAIPANFPNLAGLLTECERRRNLLCHGVWMEDPETKELCVQNPSGEWVPPKSPKVSKRKYPEAVYPDLAWMEETRVKMENAIRSVQDLDMLLNSYMPPSPRTP